MNDEQWKETVYQYMGKIFHCYWIYLDKWNIDHNHNNNKSYKI